MPPDALEQLAALMEEEKPPASKRQEKARQRGNGGADDDRPLIQLQEGRLHEIASEAEQALISADAPIYVRHDALVKPVVETVAAAKGRTTKAARLAAVTTDTLIDHLSRSARWQRYDGRKKRMVPADPPPQVARIILSRDGEWHFQSFAGVITTPTLRPDGTILSVPGYDPATRLVLLAAPPMPPIPRQPSRAEADAALALLESLLVEFPFRDEASRAVALSAILTTVVRGALSVAPAHVMRSPEAGSGKTYLLDTVAAISTGRVCPVMSAGKDESETEKRLAATALTGQSIICIDNLNGTLGGDALCQLIERPVVEIRVLGLSKMVRVENRHSIFATGNNLVLTGDVTRRVLLCSLDPNLERPELRQFGGDPLGAVLADRGRFIAAAITIVRAWLATGEPERLPALASFDDWSRLVRSPLVWLGCVDPVDTMESARAEDPKRAALRALVAAWKDAVGLDRPLTAGELKARAESVTPFAPQELEHPDLNKTMIEVAGRHGEIDARRLGHWLGRNRDRVIDGIKITAVEDSHRKQAKWQLADLVSPCG